ncbi:type IX secretion system membrane protein PorP/SprF [Algivirga pacifica]|uniref:Type IX secretion system membrane protein PorP/SprF n=1 Tax=Algivirga pacifica TaxID=1162670 RepID=A0ABP9D4F7_9BACT
MRLYFLIGLFIPLITLWSTSSQAQQLDDSYFYTQNIFLINSASLPEKEGIQSNVFGQYVQMQDDGIPAQQIGAAGQMRFKNYAVGGRVLHQERGLLSRSRINIAYTQHIPFNKNISLQLGVSTGIKLDLLGVSLISDQYIVDLNDPLFDINNQDRVRFTAEFGASLQLYDWTFGVSAPELYGYGYEYFQLLNIHISKRIQLADKSTLTPLLIVNTHSDTAPIIDISTRWNWRELLWVSTGYRSTQKITLSTGFQLNNFGFGYAYAHDLGVLKKFESQQHELLLTFSIH